jgi:hypothetical protein
MAPCALRGTPMTRQIAVLAALPCGLLGAGISAIGCSGVSQSTSDVADVYSVALTVPTTSALPTCTGALAGTVAYVSSPPSLWKCASNEWTQIACTAGEAGKVAYASTTKTLWACVSKQWTQIALPEAGPPGPPGPQGEAGVESLIKVTKEPPGLNCPAGGDRIDVGIDNDGDGILQPGEIAQTAYVCSGLNADASVTADAADASDADSAFPPGLLDYPVAYATAVCAGLANCCGAGFDTNLCKSANLAQGYDNTLPFLPTVINAGHLTFNAAQAAACTAALQAWPCGPTLTAAQNQQILSACHNVLGGTIPVDGGGCMSSFECVTGAYCNGSTCAALVRDGGACNAANESPDEQCMSIATAQPTLFCNLYPADGGPSSGSGTCQPAQPNGTTSLCTDNVNYFSDYGCASQLCSTTSGTCAASMTNPADPTKGYYCANYLDAGGGG